MQGVGLALLASVLLGAADFGAGLKARQVPLLLLLVISQTTGLIIIGLIVLGRGTPIPGASDVAIAIAAGLSGCIGLASLYRGLAVGSMGVVAPVAATAGAVPFVFDLVTGERPRPGQVVGVVFALAGTVLTSLPREDERVRGQRTATGIGLALLAALGGGGVLLGIGQAAGGDIYWAVFIYRLTTSAVFGAAALVIRPPLAPIRTHGLALAAVGALEMTATLVYAAATTIGLVGLVAVIDSLFPVTTMFLARTVLHERLRPIHRVASVIVLAGVVLISAAGGASA